MPAIEDAFTTAMNAGHSAMWEEQWDTAATFYRQALDERPNDPKALTSLGLALYQLKDFDGALRAYRQAAELSTDDPLAWEKIAQILEQTQHPEQAAEALMRAAEINVRVRDVERSIELWSQAIGLKPDHLMAHSRLALVFERLGRKQQAVSELITIAGILQNEGEVQKAVQAVQHAQQVMPGSNDIARVLSMLQTGQRLPRPGRPLGKTDPLKSPSPAKQLEEPKEAKAEEGLDPVNEARQKALSALAVLLFDLAEDDQEGQAARRGLQAIVRGTGMLAVQTDQTKVMLHLSQAIDLQARGENNKALDELGHAVDAGLEHPAALLVMGILLADENRLESASRHLQRAANNEEYALGARLLMGEIYRKLNRSKEAVVAYLEALRIADVQTGPSFQAQELSALYDPIIEIYAQQPDVQAQARLYENIRGLLLQPGWRVAVARTRKQMPLQPEGSPPMTLAEVLSEAGSGQLVEALSKIQQAARFGHYRSAMEEAFFALQIAPTYLPLHTTMGDLLAQQNRSQEAVDKLSVVARSYGSRGETLRATTVLRRIIELAPMDLGARNRLIDTLVARGEIPEALTEYQKLADVYYSLADLATARKTCMRALQLAQQSNADRVWKIKILHRVADIDLQSLDWRQALRVFEQIRTLQPDDEKARSTLIDLNFRLGQEAQALAELDGYLSFLVNASRRDEALKYAENMVGENSKQPAIRRRLAELYRLVGRMPDAIEQLDSAGELLLQSGDKAGAAEVIMAILSFNPPNVEEYQQLLAQLRGG